MNVLFRVFVDEVHGPSENHRSLAMGDNMDTPTAAPVFLCFLGGGFYLLGHFLIRHGYS